jgi:hypothetical protein
VGRALTFTILAGESRGDSWLGSNGDLVFDIHHAADGFHHIFSFHTQLLRGDGAGQGGRAIVHPDS